MVTRNQLYVLILWVGFPFVLMVALALINPDYEGWLFKRAGSLYGINLLLVIQALNFLALSVGFIIINKTAFKPGKPSPYGRILGIAHSVLTFILFTLPALWVVVIWPSVAILMNSSAPL